MEMSELNRFRDDRPKAKVFRVNGDRFTAVDLLGLEFSFYRREWRHLMPAGLSGSNGY